ncbi:hypothetical protein [Bradyrhizobium sp. SZCCHNR2017]|uniref:hypothetical protein n=1 Tax=Bradyrhizobium sp. SZCCHNR2017 TaxID=3057378 RepID=UPI002916212C|nr:hypothetical protein [Bradyrhizobium sp. SZCCHNR2017]
MLQLVLAGDLVELLVREAFRDRLSDPEYGRKSVAVLIRRNPAVFAGADDDAVERPEGEAARRALFESVHELSLGCWLGRRGRLRLHRAVLPAFDVKAMRVGDRVVDALSGARNRQEPQAVPVAVKRTQVATLDRDAVTGLENEAHGRSLFVLCGPV